MVAQLATGAYVWLKSHLCNLVGAVNVDEGLVLVSVACHDIALVPHLLYSWEQWYSLWHFGPVDNQEHTLFRLVCNLLEHGFNGVLPTMLLHGLV